MTAPQADPFEDLWPELRPQAKGEPNALGHPYSAARNLTKEVARAIFDRGLEAAAGAPAPGQRVDELEAQQLRLTHALRAACADDEQAVLGYLEAADEELGDLPAAPAPAPGPDMEAVESALWQLTAALGLDGCAPAPESAPAASQGQELVSVLALERVMEVVDGYEPEPRVEHATADQLVDSVCDLVDKLQDQLAEALRQALDARARSADCPAPDGYLMVPVMEKVVIEARDHYWRLGMCPGSALTPPAPFDPETTTDSEVVTNALGWWNADQRVAEADADGAFDDGQGGGEAPGPAGDPPELDESEEGLLTHLLQLGGSAPSSELAGRRRDRLARLGLVVEQARVVRLTDRGAARALQSGSQEDRSVQAALQYRARFVRDTQLADRMERAGLRVNPSGGVSFLDFGDAARRCARCLGNLTGLTGPDVHKKCAKAEAAEAAADPKADREAAFKALGSKWVPTDVQWWALRCVEAHAWPELQKKRGVTRTLNGLEKRELLGVTGPQADLALGNIVLTDRGRLYLRFAEALGGPPQHPLADPRA